MRFTVDVLKLVFIELEDVLHQKALKIRDSFVPNLETRQHIGTRNHKLEMIQ